MSKPTVSDRLRFIAIMQAAMDNYEASGKLENESDAVKSLFDKKYQRFNTQADTILQPKPKPPRKPKSPAAQEYEALTRTRTADSGVVVPVPDGLRNDSDIRKRLRK